MSGEILLVDDDEDDAFLFELAVKEAGVPDPIKAVLNGEEALELLLARRMSPVLTVLDIKMPGVDGLEVLRRIRADPGLRDAEVVVLTGSDLAEDRAEAERLGCRLFLTKPSSLAGYAELAGGIKELLTGRDGAPHNQ